MYSAVSGLSAHQTKMNVIGNNIANVNTYGFKSSRVTFSDVFYQTMNSATEAKGSTGGTNATQLGYGAKVNSVDVINTRAGSATTDRALDVYINGDGYLPVQDNDGTIKYTRVGVLSFDEEGNLVDRTGSRVLGFKLDATTKNAILKDNGTEEVRNLVPIKIPVEDIEKYSGIAIGSNGEITAIKEGDPTFIPATGTGWIKGDVRVPTDSLYNGNITMTVNRAVTNINNNMPVIVTSNANVGTGPMTLEWDDDTNPSTWTLTTDVGGTPVEYTATYDASATSVTFDIAGGGTVTVPVGTGGYTGNETPFQVVSAVSADTYDVSASTVLKSGLPQNLNVNPATYNATTDTASLLIGGITIELDNTNFETALASGFSDVVIGFVGAGAGVPTKIASIACVKFGNSDGLSQDGESYYVQTPNSGDPIATIPGNGGTGTFRAGALEMSNVDLSREFTEMIITQRGFQANTRMITTSDEMLSELVSMKR